MPGLEKPTTPNLGSLEPSVDLGPTPTMEWIPVDALLVDASYQRSVSTRRGESLIKKIYAGFEWRKFQPLSVAPMGDGKYAVMDGQHRLLAALAHPLVSKVPCYVVQAADTRQQAQSFGAINRDRVNATTTQLFHAAVAAGDPDALHVKDVCDQAGVTVQKNPSPDGLKPRHTMAVSTIRKLINVFGDGPVVHAMRLIAESYPEERDQLRGQVIEALTHFIVAFKEHQAFDADRLRAAIEDTDLISELAAARAYKSAYGGDTIVILRQAITRRYNKNLRTRLPMELN